MANGYGNIVGRRGGALKLARPQRMRALPARRRPPRVRVRAGGGEPDPGSAAGGGRNPGRPNTEVIAELQEMGTRGAQEIQEREQARQAAIETGRMRQEDLVTLGQQARGESAAQLEGQQRQMQREQLRDIEERKNRQRAAFEVAGKLRRGVIDGAFKDEAKEGQPAMYRLPDTMQGALTSLMSGFTPQLDENGKVKPVYARLGTTQGGNPAYEFFHGDQPVMNNGVPAKLPVNAMNAQADIWDFQMSEQAGFGPTRRKARQEEADIMKTRAEAIANVRGKRFTERDRQKALLDTQKEYADLLAAELEFTAAGQPIPSEFVVLKEELENTMTQLRQQALPPPASAAGPETTQAGPTVGTVVGGFRYIGGNPNDRASWEAI